MERELVLGLPRARIIGQQPWQGIRSDGLEGYLELIAAEGEYRPRGDAERFLAQHDLSAIDVEELRAADVLVLTAPMYNFGIPSALKAWIDQIARASTRPVQFMEFCGGHTHAIFRFGLREVLPAAHVPGRFGLLDALPTTGNEHGRAFRDTALEEKILVLCRETGIGAQFGGKYFAHDVRVVRLPRHGASCPVGIGVSCSADRQILAKITRDGLFLERLEADPAR